MKLNVYLWLKRNLWRLMRKRKSEKGSVFLARRGIAMVSWYKLNIRQTKRKSLDIATAVRYLINLCGYIVTYQNTSRYNVKSY